MIDLVNKLLILTFICGLCFGYIVAFVRETYK
jgi:hypothetical protein